jgi:hypothetical protein
MSTLLMAAAVARWQDTLKACSQLLAVGGEVVKIDISPFKVITLLYTANIAVRVSSIHLTACTNNVFRLALVVIVPKARRLVL